MHAGTRLSLAGLALLVLGPALSAPAEEPSLAQRLERLERLLEQQQHQLQRQADTIAEQQQRLRQQRQALDQLNRQVTPAAGLDDWRATGSAAVAQNTAAAPSGPVGTAPPPREPAAPEVRAIPELGGVLTPRGQLVLEPALQFSNSQINRLTFIGVESWRRSRSACWKRWTWTGTISRPRLPAATA
ncbi:hypothetical protein [Thiohalobacter thiocyanaticus]|uniref:hypothetical protein n=1 Tax=Thiohalobacter thiocyanaticus TaxID=585455 RepID=UPI0019D42BD6|nr:hypothetical protein [Thiohalobacter thiocyanaticus]